MRIGIVSDTHNNLRNVARIVELFNAAGVDRIIHTGDITQAKTLEVFRHLEAPMYGVFGNNDQERDSLVAAIERNGFVFREPPFELVWHGVEAFGGYLPLLEPPVELLLRGRLAGGHEGADRD